MRRLFCPLVVATALCCFGPAMADAVAPVLARQSVRFLSVSDPPAAVDGEFQWLDRKDMPAVRPGVVICHSDPSHGGSMDDRVVQALAPRLAGAGMVVLRFNFRAPTEHGGASDAVSTACQDARGALSCLRGNPMVDAGRVCLVGHSFGAIAALRVTVEAKPRVAAYVGVSFPLGEGEVSLSPYSFVRHARSPLLFVSGNADRASSLSNLRRLTALTGVKAEFLSLVGADHWFSSDEALGELGTQVSAYLRAQLAAVAPVSASP